MLRKSWWDMNNDNDYLLGLMTGLISSGFAVLIFWSIYFL